MIRSSLFVLLLSLVACVQLPDVGLGAEALTQRFYVATNGSDANPGTLAQPFQTIQKCASVATPGSGCFVRAGTYRETIRPTNSGQGDLPIVFKPYNNEIVLISGADRVTNWTVSSGNIYRAALPWNLGTGNNQVFVNGKMMNEARYPNASLNPLEEWPGRLRNPRGAGVTYTSDASNVPTSLAGAKINILPGPSWVTETGTITASTASTFTFTSPKGQMSVQPDFDPNLFVPRNGNPYFIWGKRSLLDNAGEWFLEAGQLYLWSPSNANPNTQTVEVKRRTYAFDLADRSYIIVDGFHIFAATITTADVSKNPDTATSSNVTVRNVHLRYPSHFTDITPLTSGTSWGKGLTDTGVILFGQRHALKDSTIAFSAGNGVTLAGTNHLVLNNSIHDVNYAATDTSAVNAGSYDYSSRGHLIQYNTLYNTGRSVLVHRNAKALKIYNNHLYYAGLLSNDLGMTYTFETDGAGTQIAYNIVHDNFAPSESMGIYLDNFSSNFVVHHNIVYNVKAALNLNLPSVNNKVYNNTLLGFHESLNAGAARLANCSMTGTALINNILRGGFSVGYVFDGNTCPASTFPQLANNLEQNTNPRFIDAVLPNVALGAGSPALNAGRVLTFYTNGFTGSAPDLGALESGVTPFRAGATITEPCVYGDTCPRPANPRYGVLAEYFSDETLTTLVSKRVEGTLSFGYFVAPEIPSGSFLPSSENYSARWTAFLKAPVTGTYTFTLLADDGARLWLNNVQRVNRWDYRDPPTDTFSVSLLAGQSYPIKLEMHQGAVGAVADLKWSYPGQPEQNIPARYLTVNKP